MSRSLMGRTARQASILSTISRGANPHIRPFSQTASRCDDSKSDSKPPPAGRSASQSVLNDLYGSPQTARSANPLAGLSNNPIFKGMGSHTRVDTSSLMAGAPTLERSEPAIKEDPEPYHLHIYAHKHNTHVTCTKPNREPIISMSCGNLGYRKARRGLYDSAYSLTKYVLDRLVHTGWPPKIDRLELTLRGFGQGREAGVKVLMSPEGKILRDKIVRVSDSTRIKFGGTRSKRPRRL